MTPYQKWLRDNKIDSYKYAVWLRSTFPRKNWKDINTAENRERYLRIANRGNS